MNKIYLIIFILITNNISAQRLNITKYVKIPINPINNFSLSYDIHFHDISGKDTVIALTAADRLSGDGTVFVFMMKRNFLKIDANLISKKDILELENLHDSLLQMGPYIFNKYHFKALYDYKTSYLIHDCKIFGTKNYER